MGKPWVDFYVADQWMWNGIVNGRQIGDRPPVPSTRPQARNEVPFVGNPQSWSVTIGKILNALNGGELIAKLYMMGHGAAGEFTIGQTLTSRSDADIKEFERLRPFTSMSVTNAYIVGCESAADGPCVPGTLPGPNNTTISGLCLGQFSGDTSKPGYQLLRKLADALNAPVSGSTWKMAIRDGWDLGTGRAARLTVGPGGGWTYSAVLTGGATRFGGP